MKAIAKKSLACIVVMAMLLVNAVIVSAAGETDQNFGQKAYSFLQEINALGARIAGSEQEIQAKDMLVNELEAAGYENVEVQPITYTRGGKATNSQNVVVTKPGDSEKQIIIGAHYDSVQKKTEVDGVFSTGVDDNGSGTSVTLESALRMIGVDTKYTLKYVFFGAEETGLCEVDVAGRTRQHRAHDQPGLGSRGRQNVYLRRRKAGRRREGHLGVRAEHGARQRARPRHPPEPGQKQQLPRALHRRLERPRFV